MRLLAQVEDSVLWLLMPLPSAMANLRAEAVRHGVNPDRLVFAEFKPQRKHLARMRIADLFMDTFPYTAHTTASDALRAGCPIVTMYGSGFASRVCGSLLRTIGLPELAVASLAEYEALGLRLPRQPELLRAAKARLASNLGASPLFNAGRFAGNIERAFLEMVRVASVGQKPAEINLECLSTSLSEPGSE
jgi:predicted O-linked N-acetylglucosamine transferase (SPINDLY family)